MPAPDGRRRTGILGGTFDPIHNGHLAIAREAQRLIGLDCVLFVPSTGYPARTPGTVLSFEHRSAMIELATSEYPWAELCRIEQEQSLSGYAVDTVAALKVRFPENDYRFIIGADLLTTLSKWYDAERLKQEVGFVALSRQGYDLAHSPELDGWGIAWYYASTPDISSTQIRPLLKEPVEWTKLNALLPPSVVSYIQLHGLYS